MRKQPSIAKIARPRLPAVLVRTRLFRLLDTGRPLPVTWVAGPAGSGKTTLVASYLDARRLPCIWYQLDEGDGDVATFFYYLGLAARTSAPRSKPDLPLFTPEYLNNLPVFTRRYFETLCARVKPPFAIVLDNYHHIAPGSRFHDVIREAFSAIPEGVTVMIISRGAPPPALALFQTYNKIHCVGWEELKFDAPEARSLLKSGRAKAVSSAALGELLRITTGWAAGLVLLGERMKKDGLGPFELDRPNLGELFDYFARELFEKTNRDLQAFLLKTSFLPSISPRAATVLTGREDAEALLAGLSRTHFFTERRSLSDPLYQYHPLFREFLKARARETYARDELYDLMRRAAQLLEAAGGTEAAAELYRSSEEWGRFAALILSNAESLTSQGRNRPLENWLKSMPSGMVEKNPWLLYWMGMCRMPFDLIEGRRYFEQSLALHRKKRDRDGVFLAWSGAVEALVQEMGDIRRLKSWVRLFDDLVQKFGFPPPGIEAQVTIRIFAALQWRRNNPAFALWNKKALALMDSDADAGLRMVTGFYLFSYHLWWIGDYAIGRRVLDIMRRIVTAHPDLPPQLLILQKSAEGLHALVTGDHGHCLNMVSEGMELSQKSGVRIWTNLLLIDGSGSCLCAGDTAQAGQILEQMASGLEGARLFDRFYYYHKSAWRFSLMNDPAQALMYEKKALELASEAGFEIAEAQAYFAMAHLMRLQGERKRAREYMLRCRRTGRRMGSMIVEFTVLLSEALFAFDEKREKAGQAYLKDAMALGRAKGYVFFCWWQPALITPLCIKALEAGIEVDYVRGLIRKCRLVPETPPLRLENWPWPVMIYTLGRFEVMKDGTSLRFPGKAQKKPLELLKVLIALGGSDVAESEIIDALWPDAEGDLGSLSFDTTLHRLRKLLGNEVLQLRNGQLSLHPGHCWTDAGAFETLCGEGSGSAGRRLDQGLLGKAAVLYKGHFLPADSREPRVLAVRERLRNKFLRLIIAHGTAWERNRSFGKAADCYRQGLEIDGLAEELYQRLMVCHVRLGQQAEAANVYHRCRTMLTKSLGLAPSSKTEGIYASLHVK